MRDFEENNCRICGKVFCCQECRERHEETFHKINPKCEICVYGRTTIKEVSMSLFNHIKNSHWPLHCVFCKKVFNTLDELAPHEKCSIKRENMKIIKSPVTPVGENYKEPSPKITPFYKNIISGNQQQCGTAMTIAATSTPLIHKEENNYISNNKQFCSTISTVSTPSLNKDELDQKEKVTPNEECDIKYIYKSNLKLTGSGNLNDSKKSERRVTFNETPLTDENYRKKKCIPMKQKMKSIQQETSNSSSDLLLSDNSDNSLKDETFATACNTSLVDEEKPKKIIVRCDSVTTIWESALTNVEVNTSKILSSTKNSSVNSSYLDCSNIEINKSIWSSMTNIVKSVVHNISITAQNSFSNVGTKRRQPDNSSDDEIPRFKRMKLTELKCRRPIRHISPLYQIRHARPTYVDKSTQTDEIWM